MSEGSKVLYTAVAHVPQSIALSTFQPNSHEMSSAHREQVFYSS